MSRIFNICTFLFAFFMPFQDLPRLELWGMSIRFAVFTIVPISFCLFTKIFTKQLSWKRMADKKFLCLLLTFAIGLILIFPNGTPPRSVGFVVWFAFSIIFFLSVIHIDHRGALWGLLGGQIFNSCYILLQNYFFPWIWVPESYFRTFRSGQFRNYGLVGEPSYLAILLIPALIYVYEKMEGWKRTVLCALFIISLFLSYSGIGFISLGAFVIFALVKKNRTIFFKSILPLLVLGFLISALQHPQYYGMPYQSLLGLADRKSVDPGKEKMVPKKISIEKNSQKIIYGQGVSVDSVSRLRYLNCAFNYFRLHPWGVGPGNSLTALKDFYYPKGVPSASKCYEAVHNIFLEIAIEFGIWGLVTFSLFLFFLLWPFWLAKAWTPLMMCIGMLVPMQFAQNINMPGMWITLAVAAGLFNRRHTAKHNRAV